MFIYLFSFRLAMLIIGIAPLPDINPVGDLRMENDARYFMAIAETGSISKAARRMHVSQPALSQRLKQLETQLGVCLIDRERMPLALTYAGRVYLEWAHNTTDSQDVMLRKLADIADASIRRLQVGVSLPRGNEMLPDIIAEFYQQTTGCTLFLREAGLPQTHNLQLANTEIDFAVLTPVHPEPTLFEGEVICNERMLLVTPVSCDIPTTVSPDSPYPLVDPKSIANLRFIMPPNNLKLHWIIRSMMDRAHVKLNASLHSCSNEMTIHLVRRGLGVSIMPNTFLFSQKSDEVSLFSIKGFDSLGQLYYNRRIGSTISDDEALFMDILRAKISALPAFKPEKH